ncbi:MAG: ribokinase [Lacrimispora sp.]|uniref:ribokinase n=1 Tax=Lacrimispora sp. TaxID=2719234 RepID=UPI0039E2D5D1
MRKSVFVFGSYVTDICARTDTFPVAGETIKGKSFKMGPGGKGSNQAVAAKRAGAEVTFVTRLGADALGKAAIEFYKEEGLCTDGVIIDKEHQTGAALIIVDEATAQNQIVVVGGACENFKDEEMQEILKKLEQSHILLLQLETNLEPVKMLLKHAKKGGIMTILNPAPAQHLEDEYLQCVDIITPNETEAQTLTGVDTSNREGVKKAAARLLEKGIGKVVITLGGDGVYANDGNEERFFDIVTCGTPVDTTGAGDAFSGGLAAALSRGMDFFEAIRYGSTVAGIAVTRYGTAPGMPYEEEIDRIFKHNLK